MASVNATTAAPTASGTRIGIRTLSICRGPKAYYPAADRPASDKTLAGCSVAHTNFTLASAYCTNSASLIYRVAPYAKHRRRCAHNAHEAAAIAEIDLRDDFPEELPYAPP